MPKIIDFSQPITRVILEFPEVKDILYQLGFDMINNAVARATIGKITSINKASRIKKIPIETIAKAFVDHGFQIVNKENQMKRKIIQIDEEKCNGCGACANACHEGAIEMIDGKAKLTRDDYCDGLGDCLPACPTGAISFVEREAAAYNEAAVLKNKQAKMQEKMKNGGIALAHHGCPGHKAVTLHHNDQVPCSEPNKTTVSRLGQWPCQIKLVNVNAPYFNNAKLLICADCAAYAYANLHEDFMKGKITIIGCPKLDDVDYSEKLTEILLRNDIKSVNIVRMEVPCCGGLENAVKKALQDSGKFIPWQVTTISIDGKILD